MLQDRKTLTLLCPEHTEEAPSVGKYIHLVCLEVTEHEVPLAIPFWQFLLMQEKLIFLYISVIHFLNFCITTFCRSSVGFERLQALNYLPQLNVKI